MRLIALRKSDSRESFFVSVMHVSQCRFGDGEVQRRVAKNPISTTNPASDGGFSYSR